MYKLNATCRLGSDLLFNRMIDDLGDVPNPRKPKEEFIKQAYEKAYKDDRGLYIPKHMLKSVIIAGSKMAKLKHGRSALWKYLKPTLFVSSHSYLGINEPDYIHESIVFKKDGVAIKLYRPAIKEDREFSFEIVEHDDNIRPKLIEAAINHGGVYSGIGSFRPEYGRFELIKISVVE